VAPDSDRSGFDFCPSHVLCDGPQLPHVQNGGSKSPCLFDGEHKMRYHNKVLAQAWPRVSAEWMPLLGTCCTEGHGLGGEFGPHRAP